MSELRRECARLYTISGAPERAQARLTQARLIQAQQSSYVAVILRTGHSPERHFSRFVLYEKTE